MQHTNIRIPSSPSIGIPVGVVAVGVVTEGVVVGVVAVGVAVLERIVP